MVQSVASLLGARLTEYEKVINGCIPVYLRPFTYNIRVEMAARIETVYYRKCFVLMTFLDRMRFRFNCYRRFGLGAESV